MSDLELFLERIRELDTEENIVDFCRKYLIHGTPYIFKEDENQYYEFRKRISNQFNIPFYEIYITGSAKLGFSLFKEKIFDYDSDIDVALVSSQLYEEMLEPIYYYEMELRKGRQVLTDPESEEYYSFLKYTAIGWIRPDKLPLSFGVKKFKQKWFDFFQSISYGKSEVGDYKVSAGVFKSYSYFEKYTISTLKKIVNSQKIKKSLILKKN
jgi:predicted nucleotidyltransferase